MSSGERVYDVMVIGAGFAGMAAALFAASRGRSVALAGSTGGIDFSTGLIDLMGVHPVEQGRRWDDPWAAIRAVVRDCPEHPYALVPEAQIRIALKQFSDFLAEQGLPYVGDHDRNIPVITPAGTVKRTFFTPASAHAGTVAFEEKAPTLLVDFHGLKGFSGAQIVENLGPQWPDLRTVRIDFPGGRGELYPEHMAWTMADPARREELVKHLAEHVGNACFIGFPAILGLIDPMKIIHHLESLTGLRIFEIPTLPPSIAGTRLRAAFDRGLPGLGADTFSQKMVIQGEREDGGTFLFRVGNERHNLSVRSRAAILATGRFFGKGLRTDRKKVFEPIFNLPVIQPQARTDWHQERFFDAQGHPVNMAGVQVDDCMRPLNDSGKSAYGNLYAAGAVLAHHDWMRMKCGAGLAVATAYKAVACMAESG
ncbi:glycerol-3-phosphate dehydrogenase subunit GlpB [Pseudodesulfovibrio tunisiensis]|uniref:glycerol-3-phosphate dehydrogenase subunit GlpB n=1 Tax=Pseudodesulfovibrio tunisiensis TaxID=463192 RepID=UPI001FB38E21|nr:glycerol-3-phosphate dehydrogenase subunit GlpB [Pseudodesulfovibrio tunisiensis]